MLNVPQSADMDCVWIQWDTVKNQVLKMVYIIVKPNCGLGKLFFSLGRENLGVLYCFYQDG